MRRLPGANVLWLAAGLAALLVPTLSSSDPFDAKAFNLADSLLPPGSAGAFGRVVHWLGTDDQGRDLLEAVIFGMRSSLLVGAAAMVLAAAIGVPLGLAAGYAGGVADALLMRLADVQLAFPALLVALLAGGVTEAILPNGLRDKAAMTVLVFAIGISRWPQFARIVRGSTRAERGRDYVLAAHVIGVRPTRIALTHILPNVAGSALVVATLTIGLAILDEATLSFLGLGLPVDRPSLGTLVRMGSDFLYSGEWWLTVVPGAALVVLVLFINRLGDELQARLTGDDPQTVRV